MRKAKPIFADIANVTAGAVLFGVSINIFLIPNDLVAGGSSGAATLLAHLTGSAWVFSIFSLTFRSSP